MHLSKQIKFLVHVTYTIPRRSIPLFPPPRSLLCQGHSFTMVHLKLAWLCIGTVINSQQHTLFSVPCYFFIPPLFKKMAKSCEKMGVLNVENDLQALVFFWKNLGNCLSLSLPIYSGTTIWNLGITTLNYKKVDKMLCSSCTTSDQLQKHIIYSSCVVKL